MWGASRLDVHPRPHFASQKRPRTARFARIGASRDQANPLLGSRMNGRELGTQSPFLAVETATEPRVRGLIRILACARTRGHASRARPCTRGHIRFAKRPRTARFARRALRAISLQKCEISDFAVGAKAPMRVRVGQPSAAIPSTRGHILLRKKGREQLASLAGRLTARSGCIVQNLRFCTKNRRFLVILRSTFGSFWPREAGLKIGPKLSEKSQIFRSLALAIHLPQGDFCRFWSPACVVLCFWAV